MDPAGDATPHGSLVEQEAEKLFQSGWNCAESVFQALHAHFGEGAAPVHLVTGLGGGLASKRTCGALTGAVVGLGLACGRRSPDDAAKTAAYAKVNELYRAFRDTFHTTECWELTSGYEDAQARKRRCTLLVKTAARRAADLMSGRPVEGHE